MSVEAILKHDQDALEKCGWYAHIVPSGDRTPFGYNYHTHGMEGSYKHRNIQIVMPLKPTTAHAIMNVIVDHVKNGEIFEPNKDYADIVAGGFIVRFIEAKECGRPVLRMLVPDPNGKYEGEYAKQFIMLDSNEGLAEDEKVTHQID